MQTRTTEINLLTTEVFQRLGLLHPSTQETNLMRALFNHLTTHREINFDARLSPREQNCLQLVSQGNSLEEIAEVLQIKRTTVATFIKRIKKKLCCETLAQAVFRGMQDE